MKHFVLSLLILFCSTSCSSFSPLPEPEDASIAPTTPMQSLLQSLPDPAERVVVSVYAFDDQTGQHKPSELPQYSRAVTQGGLSILKGALLDAGRHNWFRVLERGGLDHLLKEREIIRAMRAQYKRSDGKAFDALAPMLYAGVLFEGGIVSYESDTITGGIGARYLGSGGSANYRRDVVTVSLRAVSVATGEVLLSTLASKTICSSGIQGGVFRYVSFDKLLEAETGITKNEPPQLAVRQAIELAVYSLVMDGYGKGYWKFKNKAQGKAEYSRYMGKFRAKDALSDPASSSRETAVPDALTSMTSAPASSVPMSVARSNRVSEDAPPAGAPAKTHSIENVLSSRKAKVSEGSASAVAPADLRCSGGKKANGADTAVERPSDGYYFQVSAFPPSAAGDAPSYLDTLVEAGLPLALQKASVDGSPFCRVLIGPYRNLNQALQERTHIAEAAASCSKNCGIPFLRKVSN